MFLFDALRRILGFGRRDEQQQDEAILRIRLPRENHLYCDESSPPLSPAFPSIRKSVRDLPTSSSNATSLSSYRNSGINCRRVLPNYEIPKHLEEMIKNDIVPPLLKHPLSSSNYADIFATLLYAEDFYIEVMDK